MIEHTHKTHQQPSSHSCLQTVKETRRSKQSHHRQESESGISKKKNICIIVTEQAGQTAAANHLKDEHAQPSKIN
jgi:hypothetical protein